MKRLIFIILFSFLFYNVLFGLEDENPNWNFDILPTSINSFDFNENAISSSELMSIASTMFSLSFGVGYHLNIIPYVFSPGIYIDWGIGYLSFIEGLFFSSDAYDDKYNTFGGWAGIRLYNRFNFFDLFDIEPFAGLSLYGFSGLGLPVSTFGILFVYKNYGYIDYGIELSWHYPLSNKDKIFHGNRVSFIWRF
jgi:hypothetical protein